jgi:membrane associated rhomboid family serine protease
MRDPLLVKNIPVSLFFSISIIVIFALYITTAIKSIPCGKDIFSVFYSNFIHVDIYHLTGNILALYSLSRVERAIGVKKFFGLIIFLLIFTTIAEVTFYKMYPKEPCSVGFSGVLFGIVSWELITTKKLDYTLLLSIFFMVILPSLTNSKISLTSHIIGAMAGIVGGVIWKKFNF